MSRRFYTIVGWLLIVGTVFLGFPSALAHHGRAYTTGGSMKSQSGPLGVKLEGNGQIFYEDYWTMSWPVIVASSVILIGGVLTLRLRPRRKYPYLRMC